jgi:Ser/Thr protein kinase RdoA (MazF antagonist)
MRQYGWQPTLLQQRGNVWQVGSGDKTFALKCSKAAREKLLLVRQMLEEIRAQGYPHLLPWIPTVHGEWVVAGPSGRWYATPWKEAYGVEGDTRKSVGVELMRGLARLHRSAEPVVAPYAELKRQMGEREITQWKQKQEQWQEAKGEREFKSPFEQMIEDSQADVDKLLTFAIRGMERFIETEKGKPPRYTLCHCRIHPRNTLPEEDQFYLVDFDHAQVDSPIRDIATVLRRYEAEEGPSELLDAYESEWKLQPKEKKLLALYLAYPEGVLKTMDQYYRNATISQVESSAVRKLERELKQLDSLQGMIRSLWPTKKVRDEKSSSVIAIAEKPSKKKSHHKQRKR